MIAAIGAPVTSRAQDAFPKFREHVINAEAGTGLAIAAEDINGDGRLDIIGVSSRDVVWYENPGWEPHLIANTIKASNVCIAAADIDGDGLPELALGADWQFNNTESGGALFLLKGGKDVREPWAVHTLLYTEPTLHRIRWADVEGDGRPELVVAPLKGPGSTGPAFGETGVHLFLLRPPNYSKGVDWQVSLNSIAGPPRLTGWANELIDDSLHVMHNVWPTRWGSPDGDSILAASFEGITQFIRGGDGRWTKHSLAAGNPEPLPQSGAGEIKISTDKAPKLATIEPWHGHQAVVYTHDSGNEWVRHVIDDALAGGHAVWWADFDGDGSDELLIGFRDKAGPNERPGLNIYDFGRGNAGGLGAVTKHVIDDGGMATEDAVAADMNGDGRPDVIAFGRATHNIKYYENLGR